MEVYMKKYLGLLLCLTIMITPALANTVKENRYSEELNTQVVDDYVNKRIKVNFSEISMPSGANLTPADYIAVKERVIADHQAKLAYYNKYYTLKLQDLSNSLDRVKATASTRSSADQASILSLHQRNINETIEQRNAVISIIQGQIDKTQAEIDEIKARK